MKTWPLRWKVALYSALLAVAATIGGAGTTWTVMRYQELAAFDRRLAMDAEELFRDVEHFQRTSSAGSAAFSEIFIPLALRDRLVQVTDVAGRAIYLSPGLPAPIPSDGIQKIHTRELGGRSVRVGEFTRDGLTLRVGADLSEINQVAREILVGMLFAIPTVLVIVVIGGALVARKAVAPVEEIRQAAAQITVHDLNRRLPVPDSGDEIAGLVEVLNAAFERLQRSLEQAMRFSADASHHLKTPVSVLRAGVEEIIADEECNAHTQATAEGLLRPIHQLTAVVDNLLLLARADSGRLEPRPADFDLSELLEGVVDDARALAERFDLTVEAEFPPHLSLHGDRAFVSLIAQNLLENAVKYNAPGGRIRVAAQAVNGSVEMVVGNTGNGITEELAPHIFERFYRVRGDERVGGSGLGLSISRELARAHGGEITLAHSGPPWTELRVSLPARPNGLEGRSGALIGK